MDPSEVINPPPAVKLMDFPVSIGVGMAVVFVAILLIVSGRFDPTGGTLTISLMIVIAFMGAIAFSMLFTVPGDEATAAVIGALVLAMGAVVSYWLGKPK